MRHLQEYVADLAVAQVKHGLSIVPGGAAMIQSILNMLRTNRCLSCPHAHSDNGSLAVLQYPPHMAYHYLARR